MLDAHIIMNNSTGLLWWGDYALQQGASLPPSHAKRLLLRYVTHAQQLLCMNRFLPLLSQLCGRFEAASTGA